MRTLNRPMFRYGGPIKEGVMHGIREPAAHGGSMGNNQGPRRAALVGNSAYPQTDGRAHHLAPLVVGGLYAAGRALARPFAKQIIKQIPKFTKIKRLPGGSQYSKGYPGGATKGSWKNLGPSKETMNVKSWEPTGLGKWFQADPTYKTIAGGTSLFGKGIRKGGQFAKYATTTPSGLLFFGAPVTVAAGRYFLSDGKEIKGDDLNNITQGEKRGTSGAPGGGDPNMTYTAPEKEPLTEAETKAIAAKIAARKKQMDMYKEILDIKGMKKDAVYKSLVDVSKQIQEGGTLKEQLKSGSLISNLTSAASKRFDKVSDTETALRSLVAKGEID